MLLKRNLLENITIVSCSGTLLCVLLNYLTNISPITGIWFPLYIFLLFLLSVWLSFKFIQWLLHLSKPVKYDLERIVADYPQLAFISRLLPITTKKVIDEECKEYDTNELSVISSVLERKLISSWYMSYISQEIGFPFACKQMLDQMIGKTFQICNNIDMKDIHVDFCTILASHLGEYKKAVKRQEKCPTSTVDSHYKKSHPIPNNAKYQNVDQCIFILRIILKELVPWELWDTPHSELLVRILAKKLDTFMDNTLADPVWLNDKLMNLISKTDNVKQQEKAETKVNEDVTKEEPVIDTASLVMTPPIVKSEVEPVVNIEGIVEETVVSSSEPIDVKSSPILRQRRGRQGRNEVKIYDRIIEGSVKTWATAMDLQCISVGQDLLAGLEAGLEAEPPLERLWPADEPEPRTEPPPLWFGEDDIELEAEWGEAPRKEKEASPKAGDALLKDLQSTVHQAKSRIGDLQVQTLPRASCDEAAGMMEGLLDFGIAGLKKGLRFTGLSDESQEKSPSHHREKASDKSPPAEMRSRAAQDNKEAVLTSDIQREDNGVSVPPLLKQNRVISQDSVPIQMKPSGDAWSPEMGPEAWSPEPGPGAWSPEPQYEEAADLSTSIAKLRCLLQQRADTQSRAEDVWWESAEETRGRTQQHHSSRPVDTATLADEYDMNLERNPSPGQTSNNMQRLDKLFHRTVTGVFNSIKTAVGAEDEAEAPRPPLEWAYVHTSAELSVCGCVSRLVGARRALSHADAALDPLRAVPPAALPAPEDVDEWCAWCGAGWAAACGAAAAAGLMRRHVGQRLATLLAADLGETLLTAWLEELGSWLRHQVFVVFDQMAKQEEPFARDKATLRPFDKDETCAAVVEKIPSVLYIFGEESLSAAVMLVISSFSHKEVNKDFILRLFDLLALHFKTSAEASHPTFDNN